MDEKEAKERVVRAGIRLVKSGLIARTWGNVSCRIDDSNFAVTPSGRDYLTLSPEEIVAVSIADLSYKGNIKPSSEKRIHAEIYKHNPNINFLIHTHQKNASVLSAMGLNSISSDYDILGDNIICASYALPGTKRLSRNIREALKHSRGKAIIMKNHGAICFGKDDEEAFQVASVLEDACWKFILDKYEKISCEKDIGHKEMALFERLIGIDKPENDAVTCCNSERTAEGFILHKEDKGQIRVKFNEVSSLLPEDARIHNEIYLRHKDINYILHSISTDILTLSAVNRTLYPMVDDFAQIVGTRVETVANNPIDILNALKNSSAVIIMHKGALCCAASEDDASAIQMILEKNCRIEICKVLFENVKPLSPIDSILMRFVYKKKYSKQMNKKDNMKVR